MIDANPDDESVSLAGASRRLMIAIYQEGMLQGSNSSGDWVSQFDSDEETPDGDSEFRTSHTAVEGAEDDQEDSDDSDESSEGGDDDNESLSDVQRARSLMRQLLMSARMSGGLRGRRRDEEFEEESDSPSALPPPLQQDLASSEIAAEVERATRPDSLRRPHAQARLQRYGKAPGGACMRNLAWMLSDRQTEALGSCHFTMAQRVHCSAYGVLPMVPVRRVDRLMSPVYTGCFSASGDVFVAAFKDKNIRIYEADREWRMRKEVLARNLRWTVTDTHISPDERFLVYSSITPEVMLVNLAEGGISSEANVTDIHEELSFGPRRAEQNFYDPQSNFGIWSVKWSADGRELVAGTGDSSLYLFDVSRNEVVLRVKGHDDDVNAVAWADDTGNILLSGSDDHICQMWDRRLPGTAQSRPVASFVGHLEGITHIDPRGDGRYFISNSKDQTIKLWDMRKGHSNEAMSRGAMRTGLPDSQWDYRWMSYPRSRSQFSHPNDVSIMTYRGHRVLQTLIRAFFSPATTTGQRYIYSGSADGAVVIWDMVSGEIVSKLQHHEDIVRDVSWHPTQPTIVSTSFDGTVQQWGTGHTIDGLMELEESLCKKSTCPAFTSKRQRRGSSRSKRAQL